MGGVRTSRRGARSKLTPERQEIILRMITNGSTKKSACEAAGICEETLSNWLAKGRKGHRAYVGFLGRYQKADIALEEKALLGIQNAVDDGDWKAGAWWLERRKGFTKSGQANRPLRQAVPDDETPEETLVRELEYLYELTRDKAPDKAAVILGQLIEARRELGDLDDGPETREEVIEALVDEFPEDILREALARIDEE